MIGSLRGTLLAREEGEVLIEVSGTGIGYRAEMGPAAALGLGAVGDEVFVWIHHHIRDDAQFLYGFADRAERRCFEVLLGTHGVGPALAMAILSVHRPEDLAQLVADEDLDGLCLVPGVGKKTAARLLIELKPRFEAEAIATPSPSGGPASGPRGGVVADVHAALEGLGYHGNEIAEVLRHDSVRDADDAESALRAALRQLGSAR